MKISEIAVHNYRSIKNTTISPSAFSAFVGQNNHGKTNLFEAIEWFYDAKSTPIECYFEKNKDLTVSVEITYIDVTDDDIEKLKTDASKTRIRTLLGAESSFGIRKTSVDHKRVYLVGGEEKPSPTGFDATINEFLPRLEYINTRIRVEDVSKYKEKNPIGQMLSGVLESIVTMSPEYRAFEDQFSRLFESDESEVRVRLNELGNEVGEFLQKQFPGDSKVRFTVVPPSFSDLLKSFETTVDDGVVTSAEDKGDGMQRAIMLSILQAYSNFRRTQLVGTKFLFLIDEAELHLHPTAQRLLKMALLEISETDQVMINTHSSVLVADDHELQQIFQVEKENHETKITPVKGIDKINVIFDLLGGSPQDLLLPRNFLIVEGRSEFELLKGLIARFYADDFQGIKVIYANGDLERQERTIDSITLALKPFVGGSTSIYRDRIVLIIDQPNEAQQSNYESFKAEHSHLFETGRVFELPTHSLEEYYPVPWRLTSNEVRGIAHDRRAKPKLAREVAEGMSKENFESQMSEIYAAMLKSNECAF